MDNYETEEQQVEAIKKWWLENYKMVLTVAILGIGGIIFTQQWKHHQVVKGYTASVEYDQILNMVVKQQQEAIINEKANNVAADFADLPYAALSSLLAAKKLVEANKLAQAEKKYQWVIDTSQSISLKHISRIQLASLLSSQGKHEQALKTLEVEQGKFKASYLELKGDILVAMNRINEAKAAYDQAIQSYAAIGANAQILTIKRNDLGNS